MLETHTHRKFNFQHHHQIKMSGIKAFCSNHEINIPQNVIFMLNRENKLLRNPKNRKKSRKIKMPGKFLVLKYALIVYLFIYLFNSLF